MKLRYKALDWSDYNEENGRTKLNMACAYFGQNENERVKGSLVISMCFRVNINSRNALKLVSKEKDLH